MLDDLGTEFHSGDRGQCAEEGSDGRSTGRDDVDGFTLGGSLRGEANPVSCAFRDVQGTDVPYCTRL